MDFDDEWDAGDMGCGELVLALRGKLRKTPGQVWKVIARDPGAPADIPAWCKMTADELLKYDSAMQAYWIKARP
ncbi:tRNA 2-thiouridine synthesizing protein A [Oxalobacteraceae bacterium GrIS 1.11]